MSRLDQNGDGFVDVNEVKNCLSTIGSIEQGRIPIQALPPDIKVTINARFTSFLCIAEVFVDIIFTLRMICHRENFFKFDRWRLDRIKEHLVLTKSSH